MARFRRKDWEHRKAFLDPASYIEFVDSLVCTKKLERLEKVTGKYLYVIYWNEG